MWDELNKFDRGRFAGSNTLVFLPPWTSEQIDWWQENIFKPHGYYPDDLGEALSASRRRGENHHLRQRTCGGCTTMTVSCHQLTCSITSWATALIRRGSSRFR
jgi:hypothetical protein